MNQSVTDISALAGMKKLVHLDLRNQVGDGAEGPASKVTDISALKELTNLTWVDLRASKLGNVDAMLGLVNMESLNVFAAHISDFSGLRNMTKLKRLEAHNNPATDLSPLANLTALEELQAGGSQYCVGRSVPAQNPGSAFCREPEKSEEPGPQLYGYIRSASVDGAAKSSGTDDYQFSFAGD